MLCVRVEAISRARPTPASQAEMVKTVKGKMNNDGCE